MRILVIGAHPDDETFGMGGTLARHVAEGDQVCVVILTDGVKARWGNVDEQMHAYIGAMQIYGIDDYYQLSYTDQQLDNEPLLNLVKEIESFISSFQPDRIYTHARQDVGQDHRRVFEAVMVAARYVNEIYSFPSPSSTFWSAEPFRANCYVDISAYAEKRDAVLRHAYPHELKQPFHPRSLIAIEQRAKWLGSLVGVFQAEEFELIRSVR